MSDSLSAIFKRTQMLFGQVSGSTIEMPSLSVSAKLHPDHPDNEKAKKEQLQHFLDIVDAARAYATQLEQQIDEMEARFNARDGDAWREKLALKILDEDEIPQRREGESIEDYRQRLEPVLIEKMLNKDGSIKPQYLNDPELSDYAQWAQKKYHYNIAIGYVRELEDPNTPPERIAEIFEYMEQNADIETLVFAERGAAPESEVDGAVKNVIDEKDDNTLSSEQSSTDLSSLMKPPS